MTAEELICTICSVPRDLHGTCCGWENASAPCNASMVITDVRHPGFGKPLNLWKHTFYEGNEDGYDISEKSGYKSGWDAGVAYASERTKELEKENEAIKSTSVYFSKECARLIDYNRLLTELYEKSKAENAQLREAMISAIEDLKDWQDAGPSRRIKDAIWSLESALSSVEENKK